MCVSFPGVLGGQELPDHFQNSNNKTFALKVYKCHLDQETPERLLGHDRGENEYNLAKGECTNPNSPDIETNRRIFEESGPAFACERKISGLVEIYEQLRLAPDCKVEELRWQGAACGILMELMDGNLEELLEQRRKPCTEQSESFRLERFRLERSLFLMKDLALALQELHGRSQSHGDIKLRNVLYKHDQRQSSGVQVKLADLTTMMQTYTAVEAGSPLQGDVYALGVTFFGILHQLPAPGFCKMPKQLKDLLVKMLQPAERPKIKEVVETLEKGFPLGEDSELCQLCLVCICDSNANEDSKGNAKSYFIPLPDGHAKVQDLRKQMQRYIRGVSNDCAIQYFDSHLGKWMRLNDGNMEAVCELGLHGRLARPKS